MSRPRFVPWKGPPPFQFKKIEDALHKPQGLIIHSFQYFVKWFYIPKRPFILSLGFQALAFKPFQINLKGGV